MQLPLLSLPLLSLLLLLLLLQLSQSAAQYQEQQANLSAHLSKLAATYGPTIIPRRNNENVIVTLSLMPLQLVDVDSVNENLEVSILLQATWHDELLTWNASEFGGISVKFLDHAKMWTPQILIHGAVGKKQTLSVDTQLLLQPVSPNDTVVTALWVHEFHFTCEFVMTKFPLDTQLCKLPLTATAFRQPIYRTRTLASALPDQRAVTLFMGNSEWNLTQFDLQNGTIDFVHNSDAVMDITTATAVFRVQRYSFYYEVVVVVPLVLLTVLQLLTYLVPLGSGEKTGYGVTILLSFTVFLLLIDNIVPKSQRVPNVVYFITISIGISAASLLYNCLLLRMYHTDGCTRMPHCVEKLLVQGLGCLMCLRCCEPEKQEDADAHCEEGDCNTWQLAAAALERLGFVLHLLGVAALVVWLLVQL